MFWVFFSFQSMLFESCLTIIIMSLCHSQPRYASEYEMNSWHSTAVTTVFTVCFQIGGIITAVYASCPNASLNNDRLCGEGIGQLAYKS